VPRVETGDHFGEPTVMLERVGQPGQPPGQPCGCSCH
jgi:hypothetical protein